jgi:group I intron endonuclease
MGNSKSNYVGIYYIKNLITDKYYVGQSRNVEDRIKNHKTCLKHNKHSNSYLQNAWNKYGENVFEFKIINILPVFPIGCEVEKCFLNNVLDPLEGFYIDKYDSFIDGYNLRDGGSTSPISEESRQKLKKPKSEQTKANMRKPKSEEHKQKLKLTTKDRKHIYKDKTCKFVKFYELQQYLDDNWKLGIPKGRVKAIEERNRISISMSKVVRTKNWCDNIRKSVLSKNTWSKNRIWVYLDDNEKMINKNEINEWLNIGWQIGRKEKIKSLLIKFNNERTTRNNHE